MLAFGFRVGLHHPRRFAQDDFLQFLILLQLAQQGLLVTAFLFPSVENLLYARLTVSDERCQRIAVESGCPCDGIVGNRLTDFRQGLHRIPGRIAGELHSEFFLRSRRMLVVEQRFHRELACLVASDRHSQGFRDILLIAQYRQHMLFSVAELTSVSHHTHAYQAVFLCHIKAKRN